MLQTDSPDLLSSGSSNVRLVDVISFLMMMMTCVEHVVQLRFNLAIRLAWHPGWVPSHGLAPGLRCHEGVPAPSCSAKICCWRPGLVPSVLVGAHVGCLAFLLTPSFGEPHLYLAPRFGSHQFVVAPSVVARVFVGTRWGGVSAP